MADVVLSSAVRNNLLSLQNTATLLGKTQERLATGLKVNSALDDPTAFFTASALNSRASDLNRLLDSVGLAVQTIEAADNAISAITDLVETAQATARQALQSPLGTLASIAATSTGTVALGTDTAAAINGSAVANDTAATSSTALSGAVDGTDLLNSGDIGLTNTDTLTITGGGFSNVSISFTGSSSETTGATLDITAADVDDLVTEINAQAGATIASISGGEIVITGQDTTNAITFGGTNGLGFTDATATNSVLAAATGTLSIQVGSGTAFTLDLSTIDSEDDLDAAIGTTIAGGTLDYNATSNRIEVSATANSEDIVLSVSGGGNDAAALQALGIGDGVQTSNTVTPTNAAVAALTTTNFSVTVGSGSAQTVDISSIANSRDLLAALNGGITGATASAGAGGAIVFTADNTTDSLTFANGTELGLSGTAAPTPSVTTAATGRAQLQTEFNALRTQIDQLASDAGFNGNNLLQSDSLSVIFNESGTSSLSITGVDFDSSGLSISAVTGDGFQLDANIDATLTELDTAISTLRQQASTFGSNLSVVETRQNFTENLINTLETGAAGLTLADTNEEGANLLALQTRQQLSSVALSLASQADQNVLRLF